MLSLRAIIRNNHKSLNFVTLQNWFILSISVAHRISGDVICLEVYLRGPHLDATFS